MSFQSNHYPETLPPDEGCEFEASAVHAVYAAARDLAAVGYSREDVTAIVRRAFETEEPALAEPGADPIPF
jgi:hypothetical protein